MKLLNAVRICEVGLRDGLQNEQTIISVAQKLDWISRLEMAGVDCIEVGSFVHPKRVPQMANTDEVYRCLIQKPGIEYRALVGNLKGVERAIACGCRKAKLNVSASLHHNMANMNKTPMESIADFAKCAELARTEGIELSGSISCPFGSPWEREIPRSDIKDLIAAYVDLDVREISLSDAPGMADPTAVYALCTYVREQFPEVQFNLHFHNTRGMGMANIIAGMEAGVNCFDGSLAGIGGCPFVPCAAGNIATEDMLYMFQKMNVETGINLDIMLQLAKDIENSLGHTGHGYILRTEKTYKENNY